MKEIGAGSETCGSTHIAMCVGLSSPGQRLPGTRALAKRGSGNLSGQLCQMRASREIGLANRQNLLRRCMEPSTRSGTLFQKKRSRPLPQQVSGFSSTQMPQDWAMAKGMGSPPQGAKGEKGPGKGKGYPPAKELTPAQVEIAKGFFESATEEQKDVLKLMGVEQPAQPTPDLTELCRQHIDALPESIKMLLEKQTEPEKAPTVTETSRKFKVATADLRELILKKSTLQLKINKTKTTYTDLLTEMQQLQEVLSKQQQEVTALQQLQDRVQAEQPPPGPSLFQTLQDLGVQISDEQAAKLAGFRFQVAEAEDAKLPTESEKNPPPPGSLPNDMDLESPPGLQPSNPNKEKWQIEISQRRRR